MRSYGTGSIIADNTKQRYIARYKDENDKTHRKTFPMTRQGKLQAEKFLKQINRQKSQHISVNDITLGEWLIQYITLYKASHLRKRSLERIKQSALLLKPLYHYSLSEIKPFMIQSLLLKLKTTHSSSSVKKIHELLKSALRQAVAEQLLLHNPADAVPSVKTSRTKIEVFTQREIGMIFHTLRKLQNSKRNTSQRYDMILFFRMLLTTGMRISELLALQWKDITNDYIYVHSTKSGMHTQEFDNPKTFAGERYIPFLSPKTKNMLMAKPQHTYVFENKNGGAMNYQRAFLTWEKVRQITGITKKIHCFRHTFVSYLLSLNKIPLAEVASLAGHASPSVTLEIYTHKIKEYNITKQINKK